MFDSSRRPRYVALLCATILGWTVSSAARADDEYTDRDAFLAAVGTVALEGFEGMVATNTETGNFPALETDTFTLSLSPSTWGGIRGGPVFEGSKAIEGVQWFTIREAGTSNVSVLTFTFPTPVGSFGMQVSDWGDAGAGSLTYVTSTGNSGTVATGPLADGNTRFFGLVGAQPFTSITFTSVNESELYGIDEIYTGDPDPKPFVNAGPDFYLLSANQSTTVIHGIATHPNSLPVTCRWLEGAAVLKGPAVVTSGVYDLDLGTVALLPVGVHTLTLEGSDGTFTVTDSVTITVNLVPPDTIFGTEADFLAAAGTVSLESFESLTATNVDSRPFGPLVRPDFTLTLNSLAFGSIWNTPFGGAAAKDGTQYIGFRQGGTDPSMVITLTFPAPIQALGLYVLDFGDNGAGDLRYATDTAGWGTIARSPRPDGNVLYFGLVGGAPFSRITLTSTIAGEFLAIDAVRSGGDVTPPNHAPSVDAGENLLIASADQGSTTLPGVASDDDGDAMTYRWLEGGVVLSGAAAVTGGACPLDLGSLAPLPVGDHTLTLEVGDGHDIVTDTMILTIGNTPPVASPSGSGVFVVDDPVGIPLAGTVADYDGDVLTFEWRMAGTPLFAADTVHPAAGGAAMDLPTKMLSPATLGVGVHSLDLVVDDGVTPEVVASLTVEVTAAPPTGGGGDVTPPTLRLRTNPKVLWPANGKLRKVRMHVRAKDDSGERVSLQVDVRILEDGVVSPANPNDVVIDSVSTRRGVVRLRLRAGSDRRGNGRIYLLTVTGTDSAGNSAAAEDRVLVPPTPRDHRGCGKDDGHDD